MNTKNTHDSTPMSREQFVLTSTTQFVEVFDKEITIDLLRDFADNVMENIKDAEKEYISHYMTDSGVLVRHAVHMATVAGKIINLRDGIIPALEIDKNNIFLRRQAVWFVGYLYSQMQAMQALMK